MSDQQPKPTAGNEYGPCAICGKAAMPKFGEFLCTTHGKIKYAKKAREQRDNDTQAGDGE